MNPALEATSLTHTTPARTAATTRIPLWLKLAYSAFMTVLVPTYWWNR